MSRKHELWMIAGSQHLYGEAALKQVAANAGTIAKGLDAAAEIPLKVVFKGVAATPEEISGLCREANNAPACVGLVLWMHTFSPARMWIDALQSLDVPFVHLHTQYNRDIPWDTIDMDFMNLNQSAHGGREFGFICSRLRIERTVVVGHWEDPGVRAELGAWARVALALHDQRRLKIARFGDNMRDVAVTDGCKVEAHRVFGYSVNGYGLGDLAAKVNEATDAEVDRLVAAYREQYEIGTGGDRKDAVRDGARIELGLRAFLEEGGFGAFTTTFENLHGLTQLPGLAVQRLMADGYGFGAEGDWKTAALLRAMKVMAQGLEGGTSFMEDYTYHFDPAGPRVLGAHMLEICPSLAGAKPKLEVHPLGIGGKADPPRLVFDAPAGPAVNASLIDLGNRFRMILNEVEVVAPEKALPKLPVARALWAPAPDLKTAAAAWILAGGAHHTVLSQAIDTRYLEIFCEMTGVELLVIDANTDLRSFKNELRWNETAYRG